MKIFVDTANLDEIKAALDTGVVEGVTTNPSLFAKEPKGNFEEHIGKIVALLESYNKRMNADRQELHLSVEVFSRNPEEIYRQADHLTDLFQYNALSIKVQVGWNELAVIRQLAAKAIKVNCTACMTVSQAAWAAKAGAKYASLFWGRIRDADPYVLGGKMDKASGDDRMKLCLQLDKTRELMRSGAAESADFNPHSVVQRTRAVFARENFDCEIIAGSIRTIWDVRDALLAGAHIVTVPYKFFSEFPKMTQHYKTDEVVSQFLSDFENWLK